VSRDGSLPPGVTLREVNERYCDPDMPECEECGLPFTPNYDGDRICSECRKKSSEENQ
jgi:hypothetical protein